MESNFLIHKKKKIPLKKEKERRRKKATEKPIRQRSFPFHLFGESQDKRSIFKVWLYEVTESKKYPGPPLTDPLIPIMHQSIIKIDSKLT